MQNYATIKISSPGDGIGLITFNRPEVLNALNTATIAETLDAVREMHGDPAVRVVVFTGEGRAFAAGADIQEMLGKTPDAARRYSELGHGLFTAIQDMDKPAIAAINGFALGGGLEAALSCDIRIASDKAVFGLPETMLGVIPGWGATQRTARLVGPAVAKELIFTGEHINAERALAIGLVNRVVPHETLMAVTLDMAGTISRRGRLAITQAKRVISRGCEMPLREALKLEIDTFADLFATEDQKEGMLAFVQKRAPAFKDR
ncbi:MAG: enoyl-CoA hydratase/isomerase family protein [Deltaproteobacteria bacterium]|nr:enoyl-CoA hydratase/isomerase family protein [Deltaproteobacteria bacterium]